MRDVRVDERTGHGSESQLGIAVGLYIVLVIVHAVLGAPMHQPHIFPDELAYLGHARYLSGTGPLPDMGATSHYHFGYSLFLVPAFALFPDPVHTYRAVIITNAFLISTLFLVLYCTLHTYFGVRQRLSLGAAFTTCLYPAFLLQSNFAWAENALIPAYALFIATFAAFIRRSSRGTALLLGVLTGFLYTIHPRALPLLPLTALSLSALSIRRITPWATTIFGVAAMAVVLLATGVTNDHLRDLGWSPDHQTPSPVAFVARAGSPARIAGAMLAAAGQVLYLAQSTGGLFLIPPLWLAIVSRHDGPRAVVTQHDRATVLTVAFVLASSLALLAESAVAMAGGGTRADHLVYGRYNEMFLPHYLACGLVLLAKIGAPGRRILMPALVLAVIGALTAIVVGLRGNELVSRDFVAPNIFGIYPLVRALGHVDLGLISLTSVVLFLVIHRTFMRSAVAGLVVTGIVLAAGALYGNQYCTSAQAWIASRDDVPSRVRAMGHVETVSYDLAATVEQRMDLSDDRAARFFSSQYLLPRTRVRRFSSERGEIPESPVVISSRSWPDAEKLRARFVTSEAGADLALWLLPDAVHYETAAQSYIGVALGWRQFPGIWESGFHARERSRHGRFRWTDGAGRIVVPIEHRRPPTSLSVDLTPSSVTPHLRVRADGVELFSGPAWQGGERVFSLANVALRGWVTIELLSDTMVPGDSVPGSRDRRKLGVPVRGIRLLRN